MNDRITANLEETHASTTWIQHRATRPRAPYRRFSGDETDGSIVPTYEGQDGWGLSISRRADITVRPSSCSGQACCWQRCNDSSKYPGTGAAILGRVRILTHCCCIPYRVGVSPLLLVEACKPEHLFTRFVHHTCGMRNAGAQQPLVPCPLARPARREHTRRIYAATG